MGFAGQIFAARVAVGLAIPSPSAFSQAGEQIGKFASNMYQKLNDKSRQAAKQRITEATANLAQARGNLDRHLRTQDQKLQQHARNSVSTLTQQYAKLGQTTKISMGQMKALQAKLPKPV